MKKVSVVLAAVLLVAVFAFVGCSAPADGGLSGKYTLKEISVAGETMTVDEMKSMMASDSSLSSFSTFLDMSFDFSGDKVKVNVAGQAGEGTYKLDGDKLTINDGASDMVFTYKDDKLTIEQSGTTLVFGK